MEIVIDLSEISAFFSQPANIIVWRIFILTGWIPIAGVLLWGAKELWMYYIQGKWGATQKSILLAIDVPRGNEQTSKAVENMFSYLAGAHSTFNLIEKYWLGYYQLSFSLEIISIEGYTQFLIWTPEKFRNLVESAIYSQYPDAEIVEVDDYTEGTPDTFPDEEYDIHGCEFIQANNPMYPIKTYKEFEHQMGKPETQYKDPMAALMDLCSSLRAGEQLWFQIILIPIGFDWPERGRKEVKTLLKEKVASKKHILDHAIDAILSILDSIGEFIFKLWSDAEPNKKEEEKPLKFIDLPPADQKKVQKISEKMDKLGFEFKSRLVYFAKKEVMNKPKVFSGFVGFMKQFLDLGLNNLKPDMKVTYTSASYFFRDRRIRNKKNNLMKAYKERSGGIGRNPGLLNIEELATIWHFPNEVVVKAPLIQKAPGRKATAPMHLPLGEETIEETSEPSFIKDLNKGSNENNKTGEKGNGGEAPPNLPVG